MEVSGKLRRAGGSLGLLAALSALVLQASCARASVAVLLEEPYGAFSHLSPSGHVAVYLDHVCAETPTHLRPCEPGELGVVISRYHGIGERDWIAMPLLGYLYAVDDASDIPVAVTRAQAGALREAYRKRHLLSVAPWKPNGHAPVGNWYELAGASFDRTIFGFEVKTTAAADADLIARLNQRENHDVFNGLFRNCADFARVTVNSFYPGAVHRNFIADLGFSSPKSVARSLAHYAAARPETGFRVFQIAQLSGEQPRSHPAVTLVEGVVKEFGVPLAVFAPITTGVLLAAHLYKGRFSEPTSSPVLNLRKDVVLPQSFDLRTPQPAGLPMRAAGQPPAAAPGGTAAASAVSEPVRSAAWTAESPEQP